MNEYVDLLRVNCLCSHTYLEVNYHSGLAIFQSRGTWADLYTFSVYMYLYTGGDGK